MVARTQTTQQDRTARRSTGVGGLLVSWRRLVTGWLNGVGAFAQRVASAISRAVGRKSRLRGGLATAMLATREASSALRAPARSLEEAGPERHRRLFGAGIAAVLVGGCAGAVVSWLGGASILSSAIDAGTLWVWAAVRAILLVWASPPALRHGSIRAAWGVGALPTLVAATPALSVVAFVSGAWLTFRAAQAVGVVRSQAVGMVLTAFGAQLAVVTAVWIFRAGLLIAL